MCFRGRVAIHLSMTPRSQRGGPAVDQPEQFVSLIANLPAGTKTIVQGQTPCG
jgi:hypothetical protein